MGGGAGKLVRRTLHQPRELGAWGQRHRGGMSERGLSFLFPLFLFNPFLFFFPSHHINCMHPQGITSSDQREGPSFLLLGAEHVGVSAAWVNMPQGEAPSGPSTSYPQAGSSAGHIPIEASPGPGQSWSHTASS